MFVKEQIAIQERLADKYSSNPSRQAKHLATQQRLQELLEDLLKGDELLDAVQSTAPQVQTPALTLRPDELDGLPDELLKELSDGAVPDKGEMILLQSIQERGGVATLDQVLVSVYRKTGEVMKRNTLTSRLYRMTQRSTVFAVPNRKGTYSTTRLSEEEARRMFGGEQSDASQQALV